jgi:hypothetical protein
MSMEADLFNLLTAICPRVYPDVAPSGTVAPYATWQGIGGVSLRYTDGTAADKRNTFMQINVWSKTRLEANTLIRQIEDALCASSALTVEPQGEPLASHEPDGDLYGSIQRFSIYSSR